MPIPPHRAFPYVQPQRALRGHGHFVSDVIISSDGQFALSGSWDGTLRLWEIKSGKTTRRFVGHSKDVLSVAFSVDNRQIVSGSRDKTVKLWNTLVRACVRACGRACMRAGARWSLGGIAALPSTKSRRVCIHPSFHPHPTPDNHHHEQGECKFTITDEGHSEWVSCVRFSPSPTAPVIVSCGWDKKVKVRHDITPRHSWTEERGLGVPLDRG